MNIMCVISQSHANADGFDVRIQDEDENKIFEHQYMYGYDASYAREWAELAHKDVENSIKYNWQNKYSEKPFPRFSHGQEKSHPKCSFSKLKYYR